MSAGPGPAGDLCSLGHVPNRPVRSGRFGRCRFGPLAWLPILAVLAGCQPLPRPFAPVDTTAANPLIELGDSPGVAVLDLAGAPAPTSRAVTSAVIEALLDRDIPAAHSTGNRRSLFAYGEAEAARSAGGRLDVEMVWHLVDPEARPLGSHRTAARPPARAWRSGDPAMVATLAGSAADGIAALIRGEDPARRKRARGARGVFLQAVGAPASLDGAVLRRAVEAALPGGGLRLVRRRTAADLVLNATITLGPPIGARRRLGLVWRLADPNGQEIGRLDQANDVEAAALASRWPALARLIARALAPDLRAMAAAAR